MWETIIVKLLLINIIMVLIEESGFIEEMDERINNKWKFYHLPHIISCLLCRTWWISLLYIIIAGQFNLLGIAMCLLNAHLTTIVQGIWRTLYGLILKIIDKINVWFRL